jgi:uncharacterized protein (TIRG00374 family)
MEQNSLLPSREGDLRFNSLTGSWMENTKRGDSVYKRGWKFIRLVISVVLISLLLHWVGISTISSTLNHAKPIPLFLALVLLVTDRFLMAYRWRMILKPYEPTIKILTLVRITFISTFMATFLPSRITADPIRTYLLHKEERGLSEVISSVVLDRFIGFIVLLLMAISAGAVAYMQGFIPLDWLSLIGIALVLMMVCVVIVSSTWIGKTINRLQASPLGVLRQAGASLAAISNYPWSGRHFTMIILFSVLVFALGVLAAYLVFRALQSQLPFVYFLLFIPIIQFVAWIPISIDGIGVQEGVLVFLFQKIGISPGDTLSYALILRAANLVVSLPGGILFLLDRPRLQAVDRKGSKDVVPLSSDH